MPTSEGEPLSTTALQIEGWYQSNPRGNAAVRETPSVGRRAKRGRVLINPLKKIWGTYLNLFLNKADAPTYEKTSGAFAEWAVYNNTGEDFEEDFHQNTHPLHFYGMDLVIPGKNGGGTAFQVRGGQKWEYGFRVKSGLTGFHVDGTRLTDGGTGFATTETAAGGPETAFTARVTDGRTADRYAEIKGSAGAAPRPHRGGERARARAPLGRCRQRLGRAALRRGRRQGRRHRHPDLRGRNDRARRPGGTVILRNLPAKADALPAGALYRDPEGFVKVAP
jgi:hypothetical protein